MEVCINFVPFSFLILVILCNFGGSVSSFIDEKWSHNCDSCQRCKDSYQVVPARTPAANIPCNNTQSSQSLPPPPPPSSSELPSLLPQVNVTVVRNISMDKVHTGFVNARSSIVYVANFTPTTNVPNVKIKVKTVLGKPVPSTDVPLIFSFSSMAGGDTFQVPSPVFAANGSLLFVLDHQVRYLCPLTLNTPSVITITVTTGLWMSESDFYHFEIQLIPIGHWWLPIGENERLHVSPADPAVFDFRWTRLNHNNSGQDKSSLSSFWHTTGVIIKISSQRHICLSVVVQPQQCPITLIYPDANANLAAVTAIAPRFHYFTVYGVGTISLNRAEFKDGFLLSVITQQTDSLCVDAADVNGLNETPYSDSCKDTVQILVLHRSGYSSGLIMFPVTLTVAIVVAAVFINRIFVLGTGSRQSVARSTRNVDEGAPGEFAADSGSITQEIVIEPHVEYPNENLLIEDNSTSSNRSVEVPSLLGLTAAFTVAFVGFTVSNVGYNLYKEKTTGNMDLCYRNNLCRDPLLLHSPLGNMLSAIPYIGASIGVYLTARLQERSCPSSDHTRIELRLGVKHNFFVIKNMAFVLLCQSFFVAINGQCPNPSNQHMDMILVYLTLGLLAYKVLTTRRSYSMLTPLAPLMLASWWFGLNCLKSWIGNTYWSWSLIALLHLLTVLYVAVVLYTNGRPGMSFGSNFRTSAIEWLMGGRKDLVPLLVGVLVTNLLVFITVIIMQASDISHVAVLLCSSLVMLHILLYLIQKWRNDEIFGSSQGESTRVHYVSIFLLVIGLILMSIAVLAVILIGPSVNVELGPAQSRALARGCMLGGAGAEGGGMFDERDLFHMLMPVAVYCLINGFLLVDASLKHRPYSQLPVF